MKANYFFKKSISTQFNIYIKFEKQSTEKISMFWKSAALCKLLLPKRTNSIEGGYEYRVMDGFQWKLSLPKIGWGEISVYAWQAVLGIVGLSFHMCSFPCSLP